MKNSAGVAFNENTDLIIEADTDGTVTSCYNKSNNTEYVGGGSSDFSIFKVTLDGGFPRIEGACFMKIVGLDEGTIYFKYPAEADPNVDIIAYKGTAYIRVADLPTSTEGNIELLDPSEHIYKLTGDCKLIYDD